MTKIITIGKKLIPLAHIVLVEPFDPAAYPRMKTERAFKARVLLIDRQSVLTEETPEAFAQAHGFRMLADEHVGVNPAIHFGVESFAPAAGFEPTKPYKTRLQWADLDGEKQSKLLLASPETVLEIAVTGSPDPAAEKKPTASRSGGSRRPTATIDRRKPRSERAPAPL